MKNTPRLRYVWSAVRPLLQGKVLYTPDTPAARRLITEVRSNGTAFQSENRPEIKARQPPAPVESAFLSMLAPLASHPDVAVGAGSMTGR